MSVTIPRAADILPPSQEQRRQRYELLARETCKGQYVAVKFVNAMPKGIPQTAAGCAQWQGRHYEILLSQFYFDRDENARYEAETAAHEIAHVALNHPVKKRPNEIEGARRAMQAMPKKERLADVKPIEDEAEKLAAKLLKQWRAEKRINW